MADQYPYGGDYRRKPVDVFLQGFLGSLEKIMQYKYQKQMEDDSATKRRQMEMEYEEQKERQRVDRDAKDPDKKLDREYKQTQIDKNKYDLANPKPEDPKDALVRRFLGGEAGGDPDVLRHILTPVLGKDATARAFPKTEFEGQQEETDKAAKMEQLFGIKNNARLSGALTSETGKNPVTGDGLKPANDVLQRNLSSLAETGVGVTGRGMDAMTANALGETSEPGFVDNRKRTWNEMVTKKKESEKDAEKNKDTAIKTEEEIQLAINSGRAKDRTEAKALLTDAKARRAFGKEGGVDIPTPTRSDTGDKARVLLEKTSVPLVEGLTDMLTGKKTYQVDREKFKTLPAAEKSRMRKQIGLELFEYKQSLKANGYSESKAHEYALRYENMLKADMGFPFED